MKLSDDFAYKWREAWLQSDQIRFDVVEEIKEYMPVGIESIKAEALEAGSEINDKKAEFHYYGIVAGSLKCKPKTVKDWIRVSRVATPSNRDLFPSINFSQWRLLTSKALEQTGMEGVLSEQQLDVLEKMADEDMPLEAAKQYLSDRYGDGWDPVQTALHNARSKLVYCSGNENIAALMLTAIECVDSALEII